VRVVFNPGSYQIKNTLDKVLEILPHTDILVVNLEEAERILGTTLTQEKTITSIIHKLLDLGAKEVAITDAARGAYAGNQESIWHMPSLPVEVLAKTGAGDAFSAGYVSARIYNHDIGHALAWGVANSCGVIGQLGAQKGLLNKNGIVKMLEKFPGVKVSEVMV
jgi:sugar/nucleoside kinase (ribokinase family)